MPTQQAKSVTPSVKSITVNLMQQIVEAHEGSTRIFSL